MITVLMIKIKIITTIATTIIMIIYIVITILIFLILTAIFILTIILPLFYDNNNYNDECNNNKGNSNSVKNNSNSKNNNDKCRHKKRKNNTNLNNDNDNRRDNNNNNNNNERSVFILGGNTVKSLNGIFTTKTNNHKCILKVRPFSSTKVQYMYDQVKLSIRDVNLANIILHVGTYDLKSKKTSSQITKPITDLTDILNNTAKRRFK